MGGGGGGGEEEWEEGRRGEGRSGRRGGGEKGVGEEEWEEWEEGDTGQVIGWAGGQGGRLQGQLTYKELNVLTVLQQLFHILGKSGGKGTVTPNCTPQYCLPLHTHTHRETPQHCPPLPLAPPPSAPHLLQHCSVENIFAISIV